MVPTCLDGYDWNDDKFSHNYSLWGAKTQGEPYHMYLLATARLIESRLGGKAYVYGDITMGQCDRAVRMANEYLDRKINTPDQCDLDRLLSRIDDLPLLEAEKLRLFAELYLGRQDTAMRCIHSCRDWLPVHMNGCRSDASAQRMFGSSWRKPEPSWSRPQSLTRVMRITQQGISSAGRAGVLCRIQRCPKTQFKTVLRTFGSLVPGAVNRRSAGSSTTASIGTRRFGSVPESGGLPARSAPRARDAFAAAVGTLARIGFRCRGRL